MRLLTSIASNTISQIVARIISSGTTFLITIIVARHFGVSGYGDLAKITAFVSFFYLLVDFGLNGIYLQIAENRSRFSDLFFFRVLLSIGIVLGAWCIAWFLPYSQVTGIGYSPFVKLGIFLFSFSIITEGINYSAAAIFQKKLVYQKQLFASLLGSVITLVCVIAMIIFSLPIMWVIIAYLAGAVVESVIALMLVNEKILPFSFDTKFLQQLTFQTLPVALMLFLNLMYFRVDSFLLALLKSTRDVGLYDFAYKFFDFFIALPLFLSNSLYPSLLNSEKYFRTSIPKVIQYVFLFFLLGIIVAIPLWIAAPLISFVKKDFIDSILPLRLLLLSLPIFFATNILQWIIIAKKQQKFLVVVYAVSLVGNVVCNILFIPTFSYLASAIITDVSEGFVFVLLLIYLITQNS